jgi:hypothetical protein
VLLPRQRLKLARGTVMGIDIGKNSSHIDLRTREHLTEAEGPAMRWLPK